MSSISADSNQADTIQDDPSRGFELSVSAFVQAVRGRLNRQRLVADMIWMAFFAGLIMTIIAVIYIWPGNSVPTFWYLVVFPSAAVAGLLLTLLNRVSRDDAAHFADQFFGLKDTVRSCVGFENRGRSGDFVELQAHQTQSVVRAQEISKIRFRFPPGIAFLAIMFCAASVALAFRPPSDSVRERLAKEEQLLESTLAINEQISELVDELDEAIEDEEERKLIKPDELRKWVDELRQTKDPKEALRQYARLERKITKASMALQQRRDEDLLSAAGEELAKDRKNKELGEKLKQKKYELAAKDLEKLKPLENKDAKLSEKRKELAKLKAAAKRMQQAAQKLSQGNNKRTASKKSASKNQSKSRNASKNSNPSNSSSSDQTADESESGEEGDLEELLEELDEAVEDYDEVLEKAEKNDEDREDQDLEDCEACRGEVDDKLKELQKKLRRLAKKRKARSKLKKLAQQCANCQSTMVVQSKMKGGKKAGKGTDDTIRDAKDPLTDNEQYTRLKGLKGQGPALTKIESADDGTGVSGRKATARKRDFVRQFESFVQREDVPEELKRGVKNYFTEIHQGEQNPENPPGPIEEK